MRQANIRFEDTLYAHVSQLAGLEGMSVSEIVRSALKLYVAIYDRTRGKTARVYLEVEKPEKEKCELVLPWLPQGPGPAGEIPHRSPNGVPGEGQTGNPSDEL